MPRWLLPLLATLALVGSSASSWAAAGLRGDTSCCCPDASKCKCHDHGKPDPGSTAKLKRCSGDATWVAPAVVAGVIPEPPMVTAAIQMTSPAPVDPRPILDDLPTPPEPPPF